MKTSGPNNDGFSLGGYLVNLSWLAESAGPMTKKKDGANGRTQCKKASVKEMWYTNTYVFNRPQEIVQLVFSA